jgi:hypothetical protein
MRTRAKTKTAREIEKHYFEQFRRVYALPEGRIEYGDKPDVCLEGVRSIGIEITRFYLQAGHAWESEQRQIALRTGIVSDAATYYRAGGGRNIELTIGFQTDNPISSHRRKTLPELLATFAQLIDSHASGEIDRNLFRATMPELSSVYLNAREYPDAKWHVMQVYSVENMSAEAVETIVRDKEKKSAEYKPCQAYWLLIVVDWIDPAQEQEIRIDGLALTSDVFEKIIVYKPNFEHVVEIHTP